MDEQEYGRFTAGMSARAGNGVGGRGRWTLILFDACCQLNCRHLNPRRHCRVIEVGKQMEAIERAYPHVPVHPLNLNVATVGSF